MTAKCPLCFLSDDEIRMYHERLSVCATFWTCYDCGKRPVLDEMRTEESRKLVENIKLIHASETRLREMAVERINSGKWKVFG